MANAKICILPLARGTILEDDISKIIALPLKSVQTLVIILRFTHFQAGFQNGLRVKIGGQYSHPYLDKQHGIGYWVTFEFYNSSKNA